MKRSAASAVAIWCLAFPVAASAATLGTEEGGGLVYRAAPGEINDVTTRPTVEGPYPWGFWTLVFTELRADVIVGHGCVAGPPIACEMRSTDAHLGDRDDHAFVRVAASETSSVWGEEGDDTVHASAGAAYAYGGPGDDIVGAGADGSAIGYGGPGNDTVTVSVGGYVMVHGDAGADTLTTRAQLAHTWAFGGNGPDVIVLSAGGSADGGRGDDRIDAGSSIMSASRIDGGPGDDTIAATSDGIHSVTCGPGNDTVTASGDDLIASDCETVIRDGAT